MTELPFSQACENNKAPILSALTPLLADSRHVLEIGSGTGQHAVYFARHLPGLRWQPSDQLQYLQGLSARLRREATSNVAPPLQLDVLAPWPVAALAEPIDAVFSANTLHIMSETMVEAFFAGIGNYLPSVALQLLVYGPFNYQGKFTSASNADFDLWLKRNNPDSGIRDIEWITDLAAAQGLGLVQDLTMPANNRLLHFSRAHAG
ncbi:class I SAM-dependent methyltransferase [Shewanella sp. AS16]|uniref:DUF938 domain-containing protein n=1 Tax=Shewanella sp. AS16 TaxID=2907625 RepID=UPI001F2C85E9|nr:DUF938 domain-containing protein [Shewanella sp. AS16]MCE9684787.1 class I SAM-dependent methyltransferase [Shewanella sp. AS16]